MKGKCHAREVTRENVAFDLKAFANPENSEP